MSWSRVSTPRFRAFWPVASSSRRVRSANASMPMASSISCAVRSCSRASRRLPWRRSHSPYSRWARASSGRSRVRLSRSIASRYRPSAAAPSLSSARQRASMPSATSVPQGCVVSASRASASRASPASAMRTAASTSSGSAHMDIHGLRESEVARRAADAASSYRARPLYRTAAAQCAQATASPCPPAAACSIALAIAAEASASLPCSARSLSDVRGAMRLPVAAATLSVSATSEAVPAKSPIHGSAMPSWER